MKTHHSFDRDSPVTGMKRHIWIARMTDDGKILMNYLNIPMSNSILQKSLIFVLIEC